MSQPRQPPPHPPHDAATDHAPPADAAAPPADDGHKTVHDAQVPSPAADGEDGGAQPAPSAATDVPPSPTEQLQARVTQLEAKLSATLVQYKEALDNFEAAKARIKREQAGELAKSRRELVVPLLDVLDNLDRAIETSQAKADDALFQGVTMVREQFVQRLSAQGLRKLEVLGQAFDPLHFEAISTVPVTKPEQDGTVVGVVREAYVMGDETVRHGLVAVGKYAGE